jgi:hypothetical protein
MKIENGTSCKLITFNEFELNQHDAEIRKQAKQEVVEELLRLVNTLGIIRKSKSFVNGYDFAQEQIKQKLNEMKEVQ